MQDVETKLAAARTRLILDKPFLGALVLRLPLKQADPKWCQTIATDARHFYYNPDYIDALSLEQTQFVLAHEALHCALSHFARRQHRIKRRWDVACDQAVNPLLLRDGLKSPPGVWVDASFEGMTAEEIYPMIDDSNSDAPMDKHVYDEDDTTSQPDPPEQQSNDGQQPREQDSAGNNPEQNEGQAEGGGAPQPPPLNQTERDNLATQWQQRLAGAAQQAMQAGKLGGAMARLVDHLLQPQLPWRMLLARHFTAQARDDYSYMRPSRREGAAIFPSLRSAHLNVVVAVDTSGSISDAELSECLAEVNALKGQIRARVLLLACDAKVSEDSPWAFEPWDEFRLPREFKGGGGTCFTPVFEWVERQDTRPDLLLYFTDADGEFPEREPSYPVLWLVKGRKKIPWGQRIQLN